MNRQFLFLLMVFIESASRLATPMERISCGSTPDSATSFPRWESSARLHRSRKKVPGTFSLTAEGVTFQAATGSSLRWPFVEVQTFDLLTSNRLWLLGYENRGWRRSGER